IEPTAMMTGIVVLAHAALIGNAMAATEYAVDGLAVGTRLNFGSASYREYKCSPSDQFDGLTWCQKSRADKERRGSYIAAYSLLHSKNGNLSYINRSQEPAFLKPSEVELNIQRYSSKLGESARILKMPHRSGFPDGVIAVWGKITLEPLDQESIKTLADGKNPRKGFLIDYLRDFTRSAKQGLPIYRIDGGPGFIWAASFDQKGRGTLRLAAVDTSGFAPPADSVPVAQIAVPTYQERLPPPAAVVATAAPTLQEELPPPAAVVATAAPTLPEELSSEFNQKIEKLQADLAISGSKIAELESAKSVAERALEEAQQARLDAENARQEVEQARSAEKTTSDAVIAQLRADKAASGAKISRWEIVLYTSVGGVLFFLIASAIELLIKRRNANASKKPIEQPPAKPGEATAQSQNHRAPLDPNAVSAAAFERDLEAEVSAINAAKAIG
ncbi:MAG: hypothetical protein JOY75_21365, partial [Hyphomicrobiales bacterium]|nr:hypothetical protein [Hyphomicrobiales bacterium]